MRSLIVGLVVAAAANTALAAQPGPPARNGPRMLFRRLDANHDGQVALDEVPDRAPDSIKAMLKRADEDGDRKISPQEMARAMSQSRPGQPGASPRGPRPPAEGARGSGQARKPREAHRPPAASGSRGPSRPATPSRRSATVGRQTPDRSPSPETRGRTGSRPSASRPDSRRPAAPQRGPSRKTQPGPELATLFALIDKDEDGNLSLEEFADGMRRVRAARGRQGQTGMGPARRHGPMMPPMGQAGPGRPPIGHPGMGYLAARHSFAPHPPIRRHGRPCHSFGGPGFGRPPMGPLAQPRQTPGRPGADAKKTAQPRINAARDRQAAAAKMRAEFAKRADAIRKKADQSAKAADREKAVKARRAAGKKRKAQATEKSAQAKKVQEKK